MEPRQFQTRLTIVRACLIAALAVLLARLWYLQIARWSNYEWHASRNSQKIVWTPASRGTIYDRNGKPLADNQVVYQIQVTAAELPTDAEEYNSIVVALAPVLGRSAVEIDDAIRKARATGDPDAVLPDVGESITRLQAIELDQLRVDMPGVRVIESRRRHYPYASLAAHVLGYARCITREQLADVRDLSYPDPPGGPRLGAPAVDEEQHVYAPDSIYGQTGVESMCERVRIGPDVVPALQGRRGADLFEVDVNGQARLIAEVPPVQGASVYLTIDLELQKRVEALLERACTDPQRHCGGGAAVVLEVTTGDILAMASYPALDLNQYVRGIKDYSAILNDPLKPEFHRAIQGEYPPASTFKMISGCAALERTEPRLRLGDQVQCTGIVHVGVRHEPKRCWQRAGHGWIPFRQAIAQSCDVYFYRAAMDRHLSVGDLADYARMFGLGEPTGCGLPGEADGEVPTEQWLRDTKGKKWYLGDTCNAVIGQGYVAATPLQMARVTATVANKGLRPSTRIIHKIVWPKEAGRPPLMWPTEAPQQIAVRPETLAAIRQGMRGVVVDEKGTARAPMATVPVSVAAKTGSGEHYKPGRATHAWFVCFAPYEKPRYAVAVLVEYGGYGTSTAGPVARDILKHLFRSRTTAS